jgi:hypothetical protein
MPVLRFRPTDSGGDNGATNGVPPPGAAEAPEAMLYRIELWDETGTAFRRLLAITASAGTGYAAYYAAAREYPEGTIILSHKGRVLMQWHRTSN